MKTLTIFFLALVQYYAYADQPKDADLKNCIEFKEQWVCEKHTKGRKLHKSPVRKVHKEVVIVAK
jgi:hypothetical protein